MEMSISLFGLIVILIPFILLTYDCRAETTNSISTPTNSVEHPAPKAEEDQQILPPLPKHDPNSVIPQSSSVEGQNNLSASSFAESLTKFQSIQKVLSQNSIRSPRSNLSVLKSLSVEPEGVTVYTSGMAPKVLINADQEPGFVHVILQETLLDPRFKLSPEANQTDSSVLLAQVSQISTQPAIAEIIIKTTHKNWQLIPGQGKFILTQVKNPTDLDSAVATIKTESPSTSLLANEIILKPNADLDQKKDSSSSSSSQVSAAIKLLIKKSHKNWQLIPRDGRFILTQVENSQSENPQILSSDSEVTPTPHSSVEIAAAIELFIKKNHNNWQLIHHEGSFILSQLKTPNDIDLQSSKTEVAESQSSDPNLVIPQSPPSSPSPQTSPHPPPSSPVPPSPSPSVSPSPSPSVSPSPQPSPSNTENSESADEIFERVFKRPRLKEGERIVVALLIEGREQGQIAVITAKERDGLQIPGSTLLEKLAESVVADVKTKLEASVDKNGNLTLAALQSAGLKANFSERSLQLKIDIPPELRSTLVNEANDFRVPKTAATALRPSKFSAFINLLGYEGYGWSGNSQSLGRQPFNLGLEGAINYQGWVLEGSGSFFENNNNNPWSRSDIRLVKDDPKNAIRYIIGDLFSATRGYQNFVPMVGFGIVRNFSLQPYLITLPTGQFSFFMENPSKVEVFVNERLNQTLELPAGPQDIRDFYLNAGLNNIRIKITDNVGQVREIAFAAPIAYDLLEEGLDQFGFTVGFPSYNQNSTISYDTGRPMLAGFYRKGITKTLTLGGYLQAAGSQQVIGTEGTLANDWGNVGWDVAIGNSPGGFDHAFRLRYQYLGLAANQDIYLPTFGMGISYLGPYFQRFGSFGIGNAFGIVNSGTNDTAWDFGVNYGQTLFSGFGINCNLGYQIGSLNRPNGYRAGIGFTTNLGNGLQLNLTLNNRQEQSGNRETQLLFSFTQTSQFQSLNARSNLGSNNEATSDITWTSRAVNQYDGINATIGLRNNPNPGYAGARIGLDYRGYVANVGISHDYDQSGQSTNVGFGTALVYADGHFGWTRPVTDSFVIVDRNENFADQFIGINPSPYGYAAATGFWGPAVIPDMSSYTVNSIQIEAPNMPLGYNLGKTLYNLLPSYKSGTVITVGTDATVFIRGILQNAKGQPINQQAGQLTSLSDPSWKPVTMFTNKVGKFAALGLKPGRYQLTLFTDPPQSAEFEISAGQTGIYDLGNLTLK
jgi:outer membrane usher protein